MEIVAWPIGQVRQYPNNPRDNDHAVPKVAASLKEFGWRQPIVVDSDGVIVVGDTRYKAALSLGYTEVPVHVARDLTPDQLRAYRLADNRVGEEAYWDDDKRGQELKLLYDAGAFDLLDATGFDPEEQAQFIGEASEEADEDLDANVPALPSLPITRPGDLIRLGDHLLFCGDSTDESCFSALFAEGETADCVWTDPPYGVSYVGGTEEKLTVPNDDLGEAELKLLLQRAFANAVSHCHPGSAWYVSGPAGPFSSVFTETLKSMGLWRHTLIWVKSSLVLSRSDFHYRHESIFTNVTPYEDPIAEIEASLGAGIISYGWVPGGAHWWSGGRKLSSVLEFPKPTSSREHPTMKPVALIERCIKASTPLGGLVLDMFGGSGSTLLAAETCGRIARIIELTPAYCDVIVDRWETVTGRKAVRPER